MSAPGADLTLKQKAFADAIIANPGKTQKEIAAQVGLSETHASTIRKNPELGRYLEHRTRVALKGQSDNARALAQKALRRGHEAVDSESIIDPVESVQLAAGAITVAAKYSESFGEESAATIDENTYGAARLHSWRCMLIGSRLSESRLARIRARVEAAKGRK